MVRMRTEHFDRMASHFSDLLCNLMARQLRRAVAGVYGLVCCCECILMHQVRDWFSGVAIKMGGWEGGRVAVRVQEIIRTYQSIQGSREECRSFCIIRFAAVRPQPKGRWGIQGRAKGFLRRACTSRCPSHLTRVLPVDEGEAQYQ